MKKEELKKEELKKEVSFEKTVIENDKVDVAKEEENCLMSRPLGMISF
jgi:hypothetical protein